MADRPRILIPTPTTLDPAYNRQCWPQYAAAVREAGGEPIAAELSQDEAELRELARSCVGVVLPGSLADVSPERYGHRRDPACGPPDRPRECCDWLLLDFVLATGTPLLAICYGMQALNVFLGGTLLQDINVVSVRHTAGASVGVAHSAVVAPGSALARLLDGSEASANANGIARLPINSSHHQAVGLPGETLRIVARSDGDGVVEALELNESGKQFLLGVQWHPERTSAISRTSRRLFAGLVEAAVTFADSGR